MVRAVQRRKDAPSPGRRQVGYYSKKRQVRRREMVEREVQVDSAAGREDVEDVDILV